MRVTAFRADDGDCVLISGRDGSEILVDGGRSGAFGDHISPSLSRLERLDLLCVSHIDQDHIAGVLRLVEDLIDWRVFDFQRAGGNPSFPRPDSHRPPEVRAMWYNAFQDQQDENSGPIEDQLVTNLHFTAMQPLETVDAAAWEAVTAHYSNLVASIREGLQLSRRIGPDQLGLPVNEPSGGKLLFVDDSPEAIPLGDLSLTLIGPFKEDLERLREEWDDWLQNNQDAVEEIRQGAELDASFLPIEDEELLLSTLLALSAELGDRSLVTTPNLASILMLVEEGDRSVLLTGDGHADDILRGLERQGKLDPGGNIHVDVLKVQHHGSEHNVSLEFFQRVTADHYIFCANGAHENPDVAGLEALLEARLGGGSPPELFKLWFTSSPETAGTELRRAHMQRVKEFVDHAARSSGRQFHYRFLTSGASHRIDL